MVIKTIIVSLIFLFSLDLPGFCSDISFVASLRLEKINEDGTKKPIMFMPSQMLVHNKKIYIGDFGCFRDEIPCIRVFSLEPLKYLKGLGRSGKGPGEITYIGGIYPHPEGVEVFDWRKTVLFKNDGNFVENQRFPRRYKLIPFGNYFISRIINTVDKRLYFTLFDEHGNKTKKIFKEFKKPAGEYGLFSANAYENLEFPPIGISFYVDGEKVFLAVSDSPGKITIDIFNAKEMSSYVNDTSSNQEIKIQGKTITINYTRSDNTALAVPQSYKDKWDSWFSIISNRYGETFQKKYKDHFPAFKYMIMDNGKFFFITYSQNDRGETKCLVYNKTKLEKRLYLPLPREAMPIFGPPHFLIEDGMLYTLTEDPENETWILDIHKINL